MSDKRKKPKRKRKQTIQPLSPEKRKWSLIGVFALGFLLYANTIPYGYTQDDAIVITENMFTQQGLAGIPGLLQHDTFYGFFKEEGKAQLVSGGRYRPLTPVMFAIEWALFGESPWVGHLINALLYGLTAVIVFFLLHWMGGKSRWPEYAWQFALVGTVLYTVHPLHTEVVANIKGRDEIMSLLLSIGALWLVVRRLPTVRRTDTVMSGMLFFLALLSKENAITFLAVLPVTILFFRISGWRRVIRMAIPFVIAAVAFLVIRGEVIGWDFGGTPRELLNNPFLKIENNRYVDFDPSEKYATITYTLGHYIKLLFIPHPLTHDYYPRHIDIMTWADWRVILSLIVHIALIVLAVYGWRKRQLYSYGILFYFITVSVVSNIVFPVGTNMSERFMYMPSLGWAIAVSGILCAVFRGRQRLLFAVAGIIALLFAVKTITRNTVWKSNYTLFTTDIQTSKNSAKLLASVGGELLATMDNENEGPARDATVQRALQYLSRAVEIHPNYKLGYLIKGNAHYYLEQWDYAIACYERVLRLDPDNTEATKNLGIAYRDAGRYFGEKEGDLQKSIEYLSRAYRLLPNNYETVHTLGVAYGLNGQSEKAVEMFRKGVELAPDNATAHFNLGLAYQRSGNLEMAAFHREKAVELDPEILQKQRQN